jgi:hypothetical protein
MLTSIEKLALAKALVEKDFKAGVGVHVINTTVTLKMKGTVTKGKDVEYTPTASIPLKATLAFMLHRMGFQREAAKDLLVEAMTDALNAGNKAATDVENLLIDIDEAMEHVNEVAEALPKQTKSGATKVDVELTEFELVEVG